MTIRHIAVTIALLWATAGARVWAQQGEAATAAEWARVGDSPAELAQLHGKSLQRRDARIAEAALTAATDVSRPTGVRLAALQTLVSYLDPSLTVEMNVLRHPTRGSALAEVAAPAPPVGAEPPSADLPRRIGKAIQRLGANDPDVTVRDAARFLKRELVATRPETVPLPPNALTLANVCGTRYRIANHADVDLSVRLVTPGDVLKRSLRIPAGESREVTVSEAGLTRLMAGGAEVAQAKSGAACGS
jgi:hypothetical protein